MVGATKNVRIMIQALLVPLHDPIRLAEQIAVLDLASGGRVSVVAGLGYRPAEYEAARQSWKDRGKALDDSLTAILSAWKGEEFEYDGHRTRPSTPVPISPPQAADLRSAAPASRGPAGRRVSTCRSCRRPTCPSSPSTTTSSAPSAAEPRFHHDAARATPP